MPTRSSVDTPLDETIVDKDVIRDPAPKHKAWQEDKVKFKEIQDQPEQTVLPEAEVLGLSCFSHKKTKTKKTQQAPFLVYWIGLWSPKIVTCFQTFQVSLMHPASAGEPLDSTEGLNLRAFSLTIPSAWKALLNVSFSCSLIHVTA